jgi:Ca2+/H+ antiporter, TMEM165/GDT1 family
MAQAGRLRLGETFGIGFPHRGRAGEPCQSSRSTPDGAVRGTVPRLDCGCRPRRDRRQDAKPLVDARSAVSAASADPVRHPATLANHAAAGLTGTLFGTVLAGPWTRWILGLSFLSVALWALFPDKYQGDVETMTRRDAFVSTLIAFFFAEIGDKTQIATVGLAARFEVLYTVVAGTTLGMTLANIPAVILGDRLAGKLPVKAIRIAAAIVFDLLGVLTVGGVRL